MKIKNMFRISAIRRASFVLAVFAVTTAWPAAQPQGVTSQAQAATPSGSVDFTAAVTPTDAKPEPVRQFTFYLLSKSLTDLRAEVEAADPPPVIETFIDSLSVSPQMKDWMKKNQTVELAGTDFTHKLTPDAILGVPEFLKAYITFNSGYPGSGFPEPKYKESDKLKKPDKYEQGVKDYHAAILRYAIANPASKEGMEAELTDINQAQKWFAMRAAERDRVEKRTLRLAQTQYLAAQTDSDLTGEGSMTGIPAGNYWLGTLGSVAQGGDIRQSWDVPVTVRPGQTTQIQLTNLNATPLAMSSR